MTTTKTETATLLMSAARILRERGLARGTYEDGDGSVCALGAMSAAYCGDPANLQSSESGAYDLVRAVSADLHLDSVPSGMRLRLAAWSDEARDADTVASQFERTAKRLMAEEGK